MVDIPIHFRHNKLNNKNFPQDRMHPRNPMFQNMHQWMSDDDEMGFGSRMNPRWGFGRGGPWGDRQCDPGFDQAATTIPIRIEAEAPPGWMPEQQQQPPPPQEEQTSKVGEDQVDSVNPLQEGINPEMRVGNQPSYASKTTSDVTNCTQEEVPRDTRSSSAPPKMREDQPQTFVSKMNITPQQPSNNPKVQKFNNVARPFGAPDEHDRIDEVNEPSPERVTQPSNQGADQKPGVVRNIPIVFEGGDEQDSRPARNTPPTHNQQFHHQEPGWHQQYGGNTGRFPSDMFDDPFFNFGGFGSPRMQRQAQHRQPHPQQQTHPHPQQQTHPHPQQQTYSHPHQQVPPQHQHAQPNMQQAPPHQQQAPPQQQQFQQRPNQTQQNSQMEHQPKAPSKPADKNKTDGTEIPVNVQKVPESQPKQAEPVKKEPPKDPKMDKINSVKKSVDGYKKQVDSFSGISKNKDYLYLDEMLTRQLLELDNIDPDGREDVRQSRRALIKDINATINCLEQKVKSQQPTETVEKSQSSEKMETDENTSNKNQDVDIQKGKPEIEKMEVNDEEEKENKDISKSKDTAPNSDQSSTDPKESKVEVEEQIETKEKLCSS